MAEDEGYKLILCKGRLLIKESDNNSDKQEDEGYEYILDKGRLMKKLMEESDEDSDIQE